MQQGPPQVLLGASLLRISHFGITKFANWLPPKFTSMFAIRMGRICRVPAESPGQPCRVVPPNPNINQNRSKLICPVYHCAHHNRCLAPLGGVEVGMCVHKLRLTFRHLYKISFCSRRFCPPQMSLEMACRNDRQTKMSPAAKETNEMSVGDMFVPRRHFVCLRGGGDIFFVSLVAEDIFFV